MLQTLYQAAIKFAGEKHKDQLVPGTSSNYLMHLSSVAMEILVAYQREPNFEVEIAVQLALLHDTVEDTDTSLEDIEFEFGRKVAKGVSALSKDESLGSKDKMMDDSLQRIRQAYAEVGLVKLADRITNLQEPPAYWDRLKIEKYGQEAEKIYTALRGKNSYLDARLLEKIKNYQKFY